MSSSKLPKVEGFGVSFDFKARLWRVCDEDGNLACDSSGRLRGWESFTEAFDHRLIGKPRVRPLARLL